MTKQFLYNFLKQHTLAVVTTVSPETKPEAAVIGIAVAEDTLEIIFDTVKTLRKYHNLLQNPHVAMVIGWDNETTVQYEGVAMELAGPEAEVYKEIYFSVYPDGRQRAESWPGIVHFKVKPVWIRYSNFNDPVMIQELLL